jgi:hypothetical protein
LLHVALLEFVPSLPHPPAKAAKRRTLSTLRKVVDIVMVA